MEHFLIAKNPQEMVAAQSGLVSWFRQKVAHEENELLIIEEAVEQAQKNKWGKSALMRQASLARGRKIFYEKALAASEAGFTLIPNMPCDVFAVRLQREVPLDRCEDRTAWTQDEPVEVKPEKLQLGDGRYVSGDAQTEVIVDSEGEGDKKHNTFAAFPTDYRDVQFPLIAARPEIMDATARAMAMRIFDQIAISPAGIIKRRKGDPMIIGKIIAPKVGWQAKEMSFLITWFVDVRTL